MLRVALLMILALSVCVFPSRLLASQDNFRQEIRACYDEAFQALLVSDSEFKSLVACVEFHEKSVEALDKAHSEGFYGALEGFSRDERKRIWSNMSDDFMEATADRLFSYESDLPDKVAGVAQVGGDGLVSLGIRLAGIWLLNDDQRCIRDGQCFSCGKQAREFLDQAIMGKDIECRIGDSRHGGSEGLCRVDGKDLGLLLVENGWAELDERDTAENPTAYVGYFDAVSMAKEKGLGIHGTEYKDYYRRSAGERLECAP